MSVAVYTTTTNALQRKPLPSLPSPTLTNPDMVLPNPVSYEASTPRWEGPPSPSYLRAPAAGLKVPRSRGNLKTPTSPATAYASSPTLNVDNGWDQHRISFAASSVMTEDLESMQMPKFATAVDSDSDNETLDESEFDVNTPSDVSYGLPVRRQDAEQSSVTLMRAEMILANAKKRLNLMDQNLRGAREAMIPLTTANLKRATSLSTNRTSTGRPTSYAQYSRYVPQGAKHSRVLSEPDASPGDTADRRYISPNVSASPSWTPNPVRASRSTEALRMPRGAVLSPEPALDTLPEDTTAPSFNNNNNNNNKTVRSASSTHNLREQVLQLRGRISSLRERAQEDNMRRQSTASLRQSPCLLNDASPNSPTSSTSAQSTSPRPNLVRITRDNAMPGAWVSTQTIEGGGQDNSDDSNTPPSGSGSTERTYTPISNASATTTHTNFQEATQTPASLAQRRASSQSQDTRHEDRVDAFDYSKFYLHSATGNFAQPRAASSAATSSSGHTARGHSPPHLRLATNSHQRVTTPDVPPTPETPAALRHIEAKNRSASRSRNTQSQASHHSRNTNSQASHRSSQLLKPPRPQRPHHRRGLSAESLASVASFETATSSNPSKIDEWFNRNNVSAASQYHQTNTHDSNTNAPRTRSPLHQTKVYASIPPSPVSVAVKAICGHNDEGTLADKELKAVIAVLEGLRGVVDGLKGEDGEQRRRLKKRLEIAGRVLVGSHDAGS